MNRGTPLSVPQSEARARRRRKPSRTHVQLQARDSVVAVKAGSVQRRAASDVGPITDIRIELHSRRDDRDQARSTNARRLRHARHALTSRGRRAAASWPFLLAKKSGTQPSRSRSLTLAPRCGTGRADGRAGGRAYERRDAERESTHTRAQRRARQRLRHAQAHTRAARTLTSSATTSAWLAALAACSGVVPGQVRLLTSAPCCVASAGGAPRGETAETAPIADGDDDDDDDDDDDWRSRR